MPTDISTDDLTVNIYFKILFTAMSLLGVIPNAIIIVIFIKNNPKELYSYSVFLVNFAVTELICSLTLFFTMGRSYITSLSEVWVVPIGPCNYISHTFCEYTSVLQTGCILNIITLIPLSFIYRYYVVTHGAPRVRNIIIIVSIFSIPPIVSVPLYASSIVRDLNESNQWNYHYFQINYQSSNASVMQQYSYVLSITFITNFLFAWLIMRKLRKHVASFTPKTVLMHKMLTKALVLHSLIQCLLVLTALIFIMESANIIVFPYCDVLPTLIYSTIPFLNGMVCLCYVPYYRKIIKRALNGKTSVMGKPTAFVSSNTRSQRRTDEEVSQDSFMDNSTDLAVDIVLKGIFTLTSILGIIPNAIIILLFYKTQKEMQSYGIFQISFALTELVCTLATWLTMNRMYIITTKNFWYVPIGPCNYLGGKVCDYAVTIQSGCILNLTMLIPMSFMYRYYVVANGAPRMRNITIIVLIFIVPPLIVVPVLVNSLNTKGYEKIPLCRHYYCFQYDNGSTSAVYVKFYSTIVSILFFSNFIFAFLILRRLKKLITSLTPKTAKMHKMLTMALIFHSLIHLILLLSSLVFNLVANKVINFPYSDVLPTLIYSTIPFLNGMVCLCFVPYYRVMLRQYLYPQSTSMQRQFLHSRTHERY